MRHTIAYIQSKPQDFKICEEGHINWYERKECWNCGNKRFSKNKRETLHYISDEIQIQQEIEGKAPDMETEIET